MPLAEVLSREEREQALLAMLLAIMGGESVRFLTTERLTPSYFRDRLRQRGADRLFESLARDSSNGFLREIGSQRDVEETPVADVAKRTADAKLWQIADRMAARARKWAEKRREAESRGEKPSPKRELFPESEAEAEAVTSITDTAADVELETRQYVKTFDGVEIVTLWKTEADAMVCPVCEPLHRQPESVWAVEFPKGPPAHVRCRCQLVHRRIAKP